MIEKVTAYKASDGETFEKLEDVQRHELERLLEQHQDVSKVCDATAVAVIAKALHANHSTVVDILTTGPKSKPKARSINGGTKKRTPKTQITIAENKSA